jgi:hypothetical protein
MYQESISHFNYDIYDKVIDQLCTVAQNKIISQLLSQLLNICEIEATVDLIN